MALTTIPVEQLSANAVDRVQMAVALKTLRDEAEARILALESGVLATYHVPVADSTALAAIAAAARSNGMLCVKLDDDTVWTFDTVSAAAASTWVVVPAVGTGRWLRKDETTGALHAPVADATALGAIAATDRADGMVCIKLDDYTLWRFRAASAAATTTWVIPPAAGAGRWHRVDELTASVHAAVADSTALAAITAADRANGMTCVKLDDDTEWIFDDASAEAASDWVIVPTAGTGRWLNKDATTGVVRAPVADTAALQAVAATGRANGMTAVKLDDDTAWLFDAVAAMVASPACIVPGAGTGRWRYLGARTGVPMQGRLEMLGAPGATVPGETVTIGADVYEARGDTPPSGGTAGRIWYYNGATSLESRTNLVDAINGVVDAARITYDGAVTENFVAFLDPVSVGRIVILSALAPGGAIYPSAVATALAQTLGPVTDIWDAAAVANGIAERPVLVAKATVTLTADMIAKGTYEFSFPFLPVDFMLVNRMRVQDEAVAIVVATNSISLTLAGGADPNNQATDDIDVIAFG